jgi:dipeptidyl aminopeptidase/acylaminoacyl peptidase
MTCISSVPSASALSPQEEQMTGKEKKKRPSHGKVDMFENYKKATKVPSPVLLIHGANDEVVPPVHTKVTLLLVVF